MTRPLRSSRSYALGAVTCLLALHAAEVSGQSRVPYHGQQVFLSGSNIAWVNFAADIGPGFTNLAAFRTMFDTVRARGGNVMRFWLHTNGTNSPAFDAGGLVTGPGSGTIADLQAILDLAWERRVGLLLCLWSFDMLRISNGSTATGRAMRMLTDTAALSAYINNALIPMVTALRGHPGIIAWEVFNEAEGMSNEFGWDFTLHVPMADIQRFVNRVAAAVHRADTLALVTNGAWSFLAQSDQNPAAAAGEPTAPGRVLSVQEKQRIEQEFAAHYGARMSADAILARFAPLANLNYYRDDRLVASGGEPDGTLDFYTVHYYRWGGVPLSPFHHPAAAWGLDKPLAVAEFYAEDTFGEPWGGLYTNLFDNGYAGALVWAWTDNATQQARVKVLMRDLYYVHPSDLDVDPVSGRIYFFTTSSAAVESTETISLRWQTTAGSSVTLDGAPVAQNDSLSVSLTQTTSFTLIAQGTETDTTRVTVSVYPSGRILSFAAWPATIGEGETSLLRWSTARGSMVTLDGVPVAEDDSLLVEPDTTTSYLLETDGTVRDSRMVRVIVVAPDEVNRALNRPVEVSASSTDPLTADPRNMVDGNTSTQWVSAATENQWVLIDLGQLFREPKVVLVWGSNYATNYRLALSANRSAWQLLRAVTGGTGGTVTHDSMTGSGRYFKILLDRRSSTASGYAVREVSFYGLPDSTTVAGATGVPEAFSLQQNYPNPFNGRTTIRFRTVSSGWTKLTLYDMLGREVSVLLDDKREPGVHEVTVDASALATGVYIYRLRTKDAVQSKAMILVR